LKRRLIVTIQWLGLAVGTSIYLFARPKECLVLSLLDFLGLGKEISLIRATTIPMSKSIPNWLIFSLPDGLWVLSYTCLILYIWNFNLNRKNIFWFVLLPILALGSEIMQSFHIISGTFDYFDIAAYIVGFLVPLIIFNIDVKIRNEK